MTSLEPNIIHVDGDRATCGKFTMHGDKLMVRNFFVNLNEQQLLDLSRLLTWWRHGKPELERANDERP